MTRERFTTKEFFLFVSVFLLLVPFLVTFNDVLTKLVERFSLYVYLQKYAVPVEVQTVGVIIGIFGVKYKPLQDGILTGGHFLQFNWNCLGWQSLLLYFASAVIALRGARFTRRSMLETIVFGLLGLFWVNTLRISFIVLLAIYALPVFELLFHNVFAAFVSVFYLLFFWWFAYRYVLEER